MKAVNTRQYCLKQRTTGLLAVLKEDVLKEGAIIPLVLLSADLSGQS